MRANGKNDPFGGKMNIPRLKTILQIAGGVCCTTAVIAAFGCFFWPCDFPTPALESIKTAKTASQKKAVARLSLQQFEPLVRKPLRRPLIVPAATAKINNQPAPPPKRELPNVRLLGIALEKDNSVAIFALQQGVFEMKRVGETLGDSPGGPRVSVIKDSQVVLRCQNETVTVDLEKEKGR